MKFIRKMLALSAAIALVALSAVACGKKVTLTPGENGLYDEKNEVRYYNASTVYEATARDKEYGTLQLGEGLSFKLYTIPGVDPTRMLATEDNDIVYASTYTLPTLKDMAPTTLNICMDGATTAYVIASVTDKSAIDAVIDDYLNAPEGVRNPGFTPIRNFRVRFESPDHPGFFYTLTYVELAEDLVIDDISYGRYFLQSLFEGTFAPVDDTIHKALGISDAETAD